MVVSNCGILTKIQSKPIKAGSAGLAPTFLALKANGLL